MDAQVTKTYRITDLEHGSGGGCFISAHDILDDDVASLFLRPEYGPPHYRGELVLWEVLGETRSEWNTGIEKN